MSSPQSSTDTAAALAQLNSASADGKLSETAVDNIRRWLTEPRYAAYVDDVIRHIDEQKWQALDDAFWTVIPFGTGGRRGRMYPIGSNTINRRTIGESAQGLADYVRSIKPDGNLKCAVAYDTRHRSREFAELCSGIMVAAGFHVYLLDEYRSTPELSFLVRDKNCDCGIMVTASHNPPSDNAVKVYWSTGGQILPPHDAEIIARVERVEEIESTDFAEALAAGKIEVCTEETDQRFIERVAAQQLGEARDLRIIYSPLHGVGATAVCPALAKAGFNDVETFGPHAEPNGDFPNVPDNVSNPENAAVFAEMILHGQKTGAEIALATDPDCDRMGCAAPLTSDPSGEWATFNGNELGALLADFVLERRQQMGRLGDRSYVVKTLVTTDLIKRIAQSYGVRTVGDLLVGFKWIAGVVDEQGPDDFVFGTEESHGFQVGQYVRDKDGAVACQLMCELAAHVKQQGQSLHEKLAALHWQHGLHCERLVSVMMTGSQGMEDMRALMERLRTTPPASVGELGVAAERDYQNQQTVHADGSRSPLAGPQGNLVILDLEEEGNYVAVRPSGTEPKVKFYMFTYRPAELLADLDQARTDLVGRLDGFERDLRALCQES